MPFPSIAPMLCPLSSCLPDTVDMWKGWKEREVHNSQKNHIPWYFTTQVSTKSRLSQAGLYGTQQKWLPWVVLAMPCVELATSSSSSSSSSSSPSSPQIIILILCIITYSSSSIQFQKHWENPADQPERKKEIRQHCLDEAKGCQLLATHGA